MTNYKETSQAWVEDLKRENAYLYTINSQKDCSKYKKFSRVWKRILKEINKKPQDIKAVFEVGFGGGIQLILLSIYLLFFNNPITKLFYLFFRVVDYNYFLSKLFPKECTTLIGIAKKQ